MIGSKKLFTSLMVMATLIIVGCTEQSTAPTPENFIMHRVDKGVVVKYSADQKEMLNGYKEITPFIDLLFPAPNEVVKKAEDTLTMALFKGKLGENDDYFDRERIIELMRKSGFRPADAYELFHYARLPLIGLEPDRGIITIVALGTRKQGVDDKEINPGSFINTVNQTRQLGDIYLVTEHDYLLGVKIK